MTDLSKLEQWTEDHEEADKQRFNDLDERLSALPETIKKHFNGSVEKTVQVEMAKFLKWIGVGGFIVVATVAVAWGTLTNQVKTLEEQQRNALDQKDLANVNLQLSNLTSSVAETNDTLDKLKDVWNLK